MIFKVVVLKYCLLFSFQTFREVFILTASTQPILSLHKVDDCVLIQDKELTVSSWKFKVEDCTKVSFKEMSSWKRSEPTISFCKCIVFNSDLENNFNKFGNVIEKNVDYKNISSLKKTSNRNYVVVPYGSKEITIFSFEARRKITVVDLTKDSPNKLNDVIMCMKLIEMNTNLYLIVCTEDGHLTLYNIKLKCIEWQVKLKTDVKSESTKPVEEGLDMNIPDVPMAIDFDTKTKRGLVGTNSKHLYCIKLYSRDKIDSLGNKYTEEAQLKIKMVLELKHAGVSSIAIKPDNKLFVLSFWDGNGIYIYNWNSMKCISHIDQVYSSIHGLYFFSSNKLAVACDGGKVGLWEFQSS